MTMQYGVTNRQLLRHRIRAFRASSRVCPSQTRMIETEQIHSLSVRQALWSLLRPCKLAFVQWYSQWLCGMSGTAITVRFRRIHAIRRGQA